VFPSADPFVFVRCFLEISRRKIFDLPFIFKNEKPKRDKIFKENRKIFSVMLKKHKKCRLDVKSKRRQKNGMNPGGISAALAILSG